jgi:NAD(P)-dependent dehydrogenase (short-subunit alcohol dehydrogenase family)
MLLYGSKSCMESIIEIDTRMHQVKQKDTSFQGKVVLVTGAAEYAADGIRINSVCPGVINTPTMARVLKREPGREDRLRRVHPIGRFGEPSEIANAALWLCSEQSSFVTGHQLAVDGGLTAI